MIIHVNSFVFAILGFFPLLLTVFFHKTKKLPEASLINMIFEAGRSSFFTVPRIGPLVDGWDVWYWRF